MAHKVASFAFSLENGSINSLATKDLPEVSTLSGQDINPYPIHYKLAFAFSGILYPLAYRLPLRVAFHSRWRQLGLPCSANSIRWVRACLSAGGIIDCVKRYKSALTIPLTFLAQAFQHLRLVLDNDVYQQFTCVTRTIYS